MKGILGSRERELGMPFDTTFCPSFDRRTGEGETTTDLITEYRKLTSGQKTKKGC